MSKELNENMRIMPHKQRVSIEIKIIFKKNQIEILQLKSIIIGIKISLRGLKSRLEQTEESVNLKIGQQKLSSLRNKKNEEK